MPDPDVTSLVARLTRLEDERAIEATMYAYGRGLDYGERDAFLNCFTEDAHYRVDMRIGGPAILDYQGRDALAEYYEWHTHAPDAWHKHVTTNPSVTVEGDTATAISYFLRIDQDRDAAAPSVVSSSGRYVDELVRGDDGSWRIRVRLCEVENL